jgi:hypothetical protein
MYTHSSRKPRVIGYYYNNIMPPKEEGGEGGPVPLMFFSENNLFCRRIIFAFGYSSPVHSRTFWRKRLQISFGVLDILFP